MSGWWVHDPEAWRRRYRRDMRRIQPEQLREWLARAEEQGDFHRADRIRELLSRRRRWLFEREEDVDGVR